MEGEQETAEDLDMSEENGRCAGETFWLPPFVGNSLEDVQLQDVALGFPAQHATVFGLLDAN